MGGYGIGVCSSGKQPGGIGGQVDIPRESSANRLDLNDLELSALGVGPVDSDAIVPPIRGIDKASIRVDEDLGRGVKCLALLVLLAKGGLVGEGLGRSFGSIPCEGAHRERQFVEQVNEFSVGRETHVTRPTTRHRLSDSVRCDGWLGWVDPVDHDLVEPEIWHEGVLSIWGKSCPVGMGGLLPALDNLRSTFMFGHGRLTQFTGRIEREEGNRSTSVLGGKKKLSR